MTAFDRKAQPHEYAEQCFDHARYFQQALAGERRYRSAGEEEQ